MGQYTVKPLHSKGGGGLAGQLCTPMREQKKHELDSAQRCHYFILSFRVGKMLFLKEKGIFFTMLQKVAEVRE